MSPARLALLVSSRKRSNVAPATGCRPSAVDSKTIAVSVKGPFAGGRGGGPTESSMLPAAREMEGQGMDSAKPHAILSIYRDSTKE
jgi:hypothetical protein